MPGPTTTLTLRSLRLYQIADALSGGLICAMVIFSPWAFGTTQPWSIRVMNLGGYALGLLLLLKLYVRLRHGYRPARWGEPSSSDGPAAKQTNWGRLLTIALAILTVLTLAYCLVSALNARATYHRLPGSLEYHQHIPWLPHSYDSHNTWQTFWNYLAIASSFWAARDWLLGFAAAETRSLRSPSSGPGSLRPVGSAPEGIASNPNLQPSTFNLQLSNLKCLPHRLRWLLWVLSLNGALLAVEAIGQRISGTNKLLWIMPTRINRDAIAQFGPYAYRSNGAQYLNLIWPVTLGLWWTLHRAGLRSQVSGLQSQVSSGLQSPVSGLRSPVSGLRSQVSTWKPHLLLPCVLLMAAGAIFSLSRGGAFVAVAGLVVAAAILLFGLRRRHPLARFVMILFFGAVLAVGLGPAWDKLSKRLKEVGPGFAGRESMNVTARNMARDYPWYGTGPGTFEPIFQLYRESTGEYWPAQLHNDWLETRITFGWLGSGFIGLAFLLVLARGFVPAGIPAHGPFLMLLWLALGGCLLHARWDFPLQIYSILFLFLVLCAILTTLSLRASRT